MSTPPEGRRKDFFPPEKKPSSEAVSGSFPLLHAGIRARILDLVLLALVPALVLIFQLARAHRDQVTRQVNSETLRLARFLASSLDRDVQSARIFLSALGRMRAWYYSALDLEWMNRLAERLHLSEGAAITV